MNLPDDNHLVVAQVLTSAALAGYPKVDSESPFLPPLTGDYKSPQKVSGLHGFTCVMASRGRRRLCPSDAEPGVLQALGLPSKLVPREDEGVWQVRDRTFKSLWYPQLSRDLSKHDCHPSYLHGCFICSKVFSVPSVLRLSLQHPSVEHLKFLQVDDTTEGKRGLKRG